MSKGSEFWGNASGKLGQQVLYRAGGEQRARMYVAKIKNPKTLAQMTNRLLMNNVVSAFRSMKPLLKEMFPTRKANQSAFNAFVQANKNVNRYYIGKEEMEAGACVPYGMQISRGSLGISIQPKIVEVTNARDVDASPKYGWAISGLLNLANFKKTFARGEEGFDEYIWYPTVEELYSLFKEHCVISLPSQFQVSVISAVYGDDDSDLSVDIWQPSYRVNHLQEFNAYAVNYGMQVPEDNMRIGLHASSVEYGDDESVTYTYDYILIGEDNIMPTPVANQAVGLILSFKDANGVQVSTSRIGTIPTKVGAFPVEDPTADFREGGYYYAQVLESYGYATEGILNSQTADTPPAPEEDEPEVEIPDA